MLTSFYCYKRFYSYSDDMPENLGKNTEIPLPVAVCRSKTLLRMVTIKQISCSGLLQDSEKQHTYSYHSPDPTLTLTSVLGQNDGLGESTFPECYTNFSPDYNRKPIRLYAFTNLTKLTLYIQPNKIRSENLTGNIRWNNYRKKN